MNMPAAFATSIEHDQRSSIQALYAVVMPRPILTRGLRRRWWPLPHRSVRSGDRDQKRNTRHNDVLALVPIALAFLTALLKFGVALGHAVGAHRSMGGRPVGPLAIGVFHRAHVQVAIELTHRQCVLAVGAQKAPSGRRC